MSDKRDEFSGIFDDLEPEDFLAPVEPTGGFSIPRNPNQDFDAFIDAHLQALRVAYMAAGGLIQPVAHLMTAQTEWMFRPTEEETLEGFVKRLALEARRLGADWVFLSRRTLVGTWQSTRDDAPDSTDPAAIQAAVEAGTYREGVFYFSQRGAGEQAKTRHGIMFSEGETLGQPIEADSDQSAKFFKQILED